MTHDEPVARRQVEIKNALGLHLRPAHKFAQMAASYTSIVKIYYNGGEFNGKSILDLASLAAECGTLLDIEARGADAETAVQALGDLVEARFHEDDEGQSLEDPAP